MVRAAVVGIIAGTVVGMFIANVPPALAFAFAVFLAVPLILWSHRRRTL